MLVGVGGVSHISKKRSSSVEIVTGWFIGKPVVNHQAAAALISQSGKRGKPAPVNGGEASKRRGGGLRLWDSMV